MPIALATCLRLPEPDPDQPLLLAALRAAGAEVEMVAWDDPAADLGRFGLCVLRSTWNYYEHLDAFTAWLTRAAGATRLANPLEVVRWNLHKGYLRELESRAGLPIVPTRFVRRGEVADGDDSAADDILKETGWRDVVIKPAVSAGSWRTRRFPLAGPEARRPEDRPKAGPTPDGARTAGAAGHSTRAAAGRFLTELCRDRDAMIQPYLHSVEHGGERSLVWIASEWTHAITKSPRLSGDDERVSVASPITPQERALGDRAIAAIQGDLLYARLDLILDDDGRACVSELELIEPSLFLAQHPPALERFVAAIVGYE
jgi:hypothetical protein